MDQMSVYIYGRPLWVIVFLMILLVILWAVLAEKSVNTRKGYYTWKIVSCIITFSSIIFVIYMTVLSREVGTIYEVHLLPLYSLFSGQKQEEFLRTLLMNILLFVPLGLGMPYVFPQRVKHKELYSVVFAIILSVAVEILQYNWGLGYAETNDVLCNTVGCAVGAMSYKLQKWLLCKIR